MRLDPGRTTDTERGAGDASREGSTLSVVWVAPEAAAPPWLLTWEDGEARVIGRDAACAAQLPGSDVSRRHAAIQRSTEGFSICDLGSRNGTRVNGRAVKAALLAPGDVLRLGSWIGVVTREHEAFSELAPGLFGGGALKRALWPIERAAKSDLPVIVEGETGTGKELVARALHAFSGRTGALVAVNCAALPENLAEAELFGYRRGAFTGAERASPGFIRSADGGTLLLDEITDLSLPIQAKLLRALEQREVLPLGETRPIPVDVRVVAAGQQSLLEAAQQRRFRSDLFARLDGMNVRLPPLRERREDVLQLFVRLWVASGGSPPTFELEFVERLFLHDWPLNVRELVLLVRRLRIFASDAEKLRAQLLPARIGLPLERATAGEKLAAPNGAAVREQAAAEPGTPSPERLELGDLVAALRASGGNVARASALLGISRQRAYRWLEEHELELETFRK